MRNIQQIRRIQCVFDKMMAHGLNVEDAFSGNGNGTLLWRVNDCVFYAPETGKLSSIAENDAAEVERVTVAIRAAEVVD